MSQYAPGEPPIDGRRAGQVPTMAYSADEWRLLVRLPGRVLVAATSTEPATPRHAVLEGLAGLEGIAAGRSFDSDLVRAVVVAIYAEPDNSPLQAGRHVDRRDRLAALLVSCQAAVELLADRADPADSAAYRQWVQSVAARVRGAAHPVDRHLGTAGEWVPGIGSSFLGRLGTALALR
ncbi:hypothetical protein ACI2K4_30330 [Micromonospora sp. NPDC050397]|uniref:hypothetical protein n=1 Tax=Micromonospora sp. NPDC050397 TaxID=3364279 RepID=UPI00384E3BF3